MSLAQQHRRYSLMSQEDARVHDDVEKRNSVDDEKYEDSKV
jgi:hypothetical protein